MNPEHSPRGKAIALTGAILQAGQLLSLLGTAIGMRRASQMLENSPSGIGNPVQLAAAMNDALLLTAIGFGISIVGVVLLFTALLGYRYRAAWFFWFLVVYGGLLLLNFPIGTAIGIFFLGFCLANKDDFLRAHPRELTRDT